MAGQFCELPKETEMTGGLASNAQRVAKCAAIPVSLLSKAVTLTLVVDGRGRRTGAVLTVYGFLLLALGSMFGGAVFCIFRESL
jgi:hypothetical protein